MIYPVMLWPRKVKEKDLVIKEQKVLWPMGPYTFAIACRLCKNRRGNACADCKAEIKSGFVFDTSVKPVVVVKVRRVKREHRR